MTVNFDILLAENKNFKIIKVKFPTSDQLYAYKTLLDVEIGDLVVVPARTFFSVARVDDILSYAEYFSQAGKYDLRWLVQRVDMTTFQKMTLVEMELQKAEQEIALRNIREEMCSNPIVKELLGKCQILLIEE